MEPEIQSTEPKSAHPMFKVTTLSKYLAMTLFILMPFVGGYIGYVYAPEKVMEVVVTKEVEVKTQAEPREKNFSQHEAIEIDISSPFYHTLNLNVLAHIGAEYNPQFDDEALYEVRELNHQYLYVKANLPMAHFPTNYIRIFLVDKEAFGVQRELTEDRESKYLGGLLSDWLPTANNNYKIVMVLKEGGDGAQDIEIYDFVNNKRKILYEEKETGVQLAAICELGCSGFLYANPVSKSVVFGRFAKVSGSDQTEFLGAIEVKIPEGF
jgi:hypothetical protein